MLSFLGFLAHAETISIGVEDIKYYPYFEMRGKEYTGFARELFESFGKKYNHKITFVPLPVARLSYTFLSGKIDFRFPDNPKWIKDKKNGFDVKYSSPIVGYTDGLLVLKKNLGKKNLKILGTIVGFSPFTLKEKVKNKEVILNENDSLIGLLEQVKRERIEGAYFNIAAAKNIIHQKGYENLIFFDSTQPHSTESYYLATLNKPEILNEFNEFLKVHEKEVTVMKAKYGLDK